MDESPHVVHVINIHLDNGVFRSKLLRALENQGGPYRVLRDPTASRPGSAGMGGEAICFGVPEAFFGQTMKIRSINGNLKRFRAAPMSVKEKRLEAAGLTASLSGRKELELPGIGFYRRYAVSVFHLQALGATPLQPGGAALPTSGSEGELDRESLLWKRLAKTAVRALYVFGLDLGEVVIRAGEEGKFTVEEIHPEPVRGGIRSAELVAGAVKRMLLELEPFSDVPRSRERLIGMDPEFLLFNGDTGKVVPASRYLDRQGIAGCDVLRYRGRRLFPLAELRPEPGSEPRELLRHLLRAFQAAQEAITDAGLLWQAGSMPQRGFPLGGHLHFSGVPLTSELLRTLDNYLALPVALLEDAGSARRRPHYGFLGDFRLQTYGERGGGFEYRTLPSFLISPLVTKGVVAMAQLITENYRSLTKTPLQEDKLFHAFYSGNKAPLRKVWPQLAGDLITASSYSRYEEYIAPFLAAVESGRSWDESADIRTSWRLQMNS
ncbi:putative amidoligase domain-containing protein [Fontibacillus sp. BL9]|uniref:putative amidoligase domain-containing protein n=1 Tax=Fontibacillus sp. BL9 TaxID=3389971 RepID=UPI003979A325